MQKAKSTALRWIFFIKLSLPGEVGKCLVGLGHAVHLVLLLDCLTLILRGCEDFVCKLDAHWAALLRACRADNPAEREREAARLWDLAGHLVVGTTNAAATHFHERRDIAHSS